MAMVIDIMADRPPEEDAAASEPVAEGPPRQDPSSLISSIEAQLAELRAALSDLGA